ncbi:WbqC family protein [Massilia yuzhufengensis]|uniref:WbqC-like protein family protein n=1 Tax=Massilia yuzhufengensis TaxID=1164594 RepID=A0A1I1DHJ1_9BURK|nr:WbqC family protein [Massilia yuzhufengensis]SFB74294.1 WbqC-like protein family protein [Massilia yuzhufengensis]
MKKVVVLQSNYIPWKGYFDLIHDADVFIFYDDVQYTKNDWRNRNKIMMAGGPKWLTIPTGTNANRLICEVELTDTNWQASHWESIKQNYRGSPFFKLYRRFFEDVYLARRWQSLSELNQHVIKSISSELLGIDVKFDDSRHYALTGQRLDRLIDLVRQTGATHYISGPAAKSYIEEERFRDIGVQLVWKDYSGYPTYPQTPPPFDHGVSIIDLLFNTGPNAADMIWGWRGAKVEV